jgi:hypothetical protein
MTNDCMCHRPLTDRTLAARVPPEPGPAVVDQLPAAHDLNSAYMWRWSIVKHPFPKYTAALKRITICRILAASRNRTCQTYWTMSLCVCRDRASEPLASVSQTCQIPGWQLLAALKPRHSSPAPVTSAHFAAPRSSTELRACREAQLCRSLR